MISMTEISNIEFNILLLITFLFIFKRVLVIIDESIDIYNKIDVLILKKNI